jgi:hypothetical protein
MAGPSQAMTDGQCPAVTDRQRPDVTDGQHPAVTEKRNYAFGSHPNAISAPAVNVSQISDKGKNTFQPRRIN